MMTEQQVVELMSSSKSEDEWNKNCDVVKAYHQGQYPAFWYKSIIASGLAREAALRFDVESGIQVKQFKL